MFASELFLALSITSFLGLSAAPGIASDPALVTKLEQARPVMRGKNGYQALFEPSLTNREWPDDLPKCNHYAQDCLAQAQQNLAAYRDGNAISFSLHPEKADAPAPTITLPLPGSRLNR